MLVIDIYAIWSSRCFLRVGVKDEHIYGKTPHKTRVWLLVVCKTCLRPGESRYRLHQKGLMWNFQAVVSDDLGGFVFLLPCCGAWPIYHTWLTKSSGTTSYIERENELFAHTLVNTTTTSIVIVIVVVISNR